jgi:hypothetical protein
MFSTNFHPQMKMCVVSIHFGLLERADVSHCTQGLIMFRNPVILIMMDYTAQ